MSRQPAHPDKLQTVTTCGPESVTGAPNCRARYTWSAAVQVPALAMASGRVRCCVPDNHLSFASAGHTDHGRVNGALGGHSCQGSSIDGVQFSILILSRFILKS